MSQFRDKAAEFEAAGAKLVGINADSFLSHQAFAQQLNIKFPLLSDYNREVIPQYAGFYEKEPLPMGGLKGTGRRAVFVVDRGGIIRYTWLSEDVPGVLPNVDEVLKAAQSI